MSALLVAAILPSAGVLAARPAAVSPAAAFGSTITTKANAKARAINVTVKAQNVPDGQKVTGYFVTENAGANPTGASTGWKILPTGFTLSDVEGPHTVYVWAKTKSRVSLRGSANALLDRVAPTVTAFDVTPATTSNATVPVTFTAADPGGVNASGLAKYAVVNGTTAPIASSAAWVATKPTSVKLSSGNGVKTVSAFARDAAGNVSVVASDTVTLGVNAPTLSTFDITPAISKSLTVPVGAKATGGSGSNYSYFLSTTNTTPAASASGWKFVTSTFTFTAGDGTKTLYGWAKDGNGTVSPVRSDTFVLDQTLPTATITVTGSGTAGVAVTFSASSDGSGSGITGFAFVIGTTAPDPSDQYAWYATAAEAATNLYIPSGNNQTVTGFVKDAAKNVSAVTASSSKTLSKP